MQQLSIDGYHQCLVFMCALFCVSIATHKIPAGFSGFFRRCNVILSPLQRLSLGRDKRCLPVVQIPLARPLVQVVYINSGPALIGVCVYPGRTLLTVLHPSLFSMCQTLDFSSRVCRCTRVDDSTSRVLFSFLPAWRWRRVRNAPTWRLMFTSSTLMSS